MKYVIVPQSDIKALEEERTKHYQSLKSNDVFEYMKTSALTERVWYTTHRRYKKLSLWNLILTKLNR